MPVVPGGDAALQLVRASLGYLTRPGLKNQRKKRRDEKRVEGMAHLVGDFIANTRTWV